MGYLKYIGLRKDSQPPAPNMGAYTNSGRINVADRYLNYLKELDSFQMNRASVIENKNSLMIGQASVVASIFSLFIPLLFDKHDRVHWIFLVIIIALFVFVLFHFLLSLNHSIKNLHINKYPYSRRSTTTITKTNRANSELAFLNEEISDLIICIRQNTMTNNSKGENLVYSARCFKIANIGFAVLIGIVVVAALTVKNGANNVVIDNLKDIPCCEEINESSKTVNYSLEVGLDSVKIESSDTIADSNYVK